MLRFCLLLVLVAACGGTATVGLDASTDAKVDAKADAAADAPASDAADASTCPTLLPQRHQACAELGQLCLYGCGIARRCTSQGWDDDLTVDAGPPCP